MIKATSPESYISVVWPDDPAVESADPSYSHANAQRWRELLKIKDGHTPTEWLVGVCPTVELFAAYNEPAHLGAWRVFLHSVRGIKASSGLCDGDPPTVRVNGIEYIDPRWLVGKMTRKLASCALWVGTVAMSWNSLSEDDGKN